MPILPSSRIATERISAIFEEIIQEKDRRGPRLWSSRIPSIPMEDGDIIARTPAEKVVMADVIELDQRAVIRADQGLRLEQAEILKLKHGKMLSEAKMLLLRRIENMQAGLREIASFDNYIANSLRNLLWGVEDRIELLCNFMVEDRGSYDKYNIRFLDVSWGMPSDLKFTPNPLWSSTSAKPVTDLQTWRDYGRTTYGEVYNRVTMSAQALRYAAATTEFQNQVKLLVPLSGIVNVQPLIISLERMGQVLGEMVGMTIEVYEQFANEEAGNGAISNLRFNTENKVVLSNSNDDGNSNTWRWGNGVMLETIPGLIPHIVGGDFEAEQEGPIAYTTAADAQGNPPGMTMWSGQRGFPMKNRETATAVATVY